jgi:hypothetical protein
VAVAETYGFGQFICDSMGVENGTKDLLRVSKSQGNRCARTIAAVVFAAAIAITGCAVHSAVQPSPAPSPPVTAASAPPPDVPILRAPPRDDPAPMLADGRYDAYIRRAETPYEGGTSWLVVDLVQVFRGRAAVEAAIADGMSHD